jgi:hypothetical protein
MTPRAYVFHTNGTDVQRVVDSLEPHFNLVVINNSKDRFSMDHGPRFKKMGSGELVSPVELNWQQMMNWCQEEEMRVHRHAPSYYLTAIDTCAHIDQSKIARLMEFVESTEASGMNWWRILTRMTWFDIWNRRSFEIVDHWDQCLGNTSRAISDMRLKMRAAGFEEPEFDSGRNG